MKNFFFGLLLLSQAAFSQRTFYVSTTDGNDSRSLQEAQNPETPWKSLKKVTDTFSPTTTAFQPGDRILFKKGDTFSGTLNLRGSGTEGNPIIVSSYGAPNEPAPVFTGSVPLTNWTNVGNGIWRTQRAKELIGGVGNTQGFRQLFVGGARKFEARFPNTGYLYVDTKISASTFTDAAIANQPISFFSNSRVALRMKEWFWGNQSVSNVNSSTVTLGGGLFEQPDPGEGYYFYGGKNFIDDTDDWAATSSATTDTLFYRPADGVDPNEAGSPLVEATFYVIGLITNQAYIRVSNLVFKRYEFGLNLTGSRNVTVDNCVIRDCRSQGVRVWVNQFSNPPSSVFTPNLTISNCTIEGCADVGLLLTQAVNATITRNTIRNIGTTFIGFNPNESAPGGIIGRGGRGNRYSYNTIDFVGKSGILLTDSLNIVERNIISRCGQTLSDLAGIYTAGIYTKRNTVRNNFTFNGTSYTDAWNNGSLPNNAADRTVGLYNDIGSDDCLWEKNTAFNNDFCGMANVTGRFQKWRNNISYKNKRNEMTWYELPSNLSQGNRPLGWSNSNEIENNIFYRAADLETNSARTEPQVMYMYKNQNDLNFISVSKNNRFINPFDSNVVVRTQRPGPAFGSLNFAQYATTYDDEGSKLNSFQVGVEGQDISRLFTNMSDDSLRLTLNADSTWTDLDGNPVRSGQVVVEPWYSVILLGKPKTMVLSHRDGDNGQLTNNQLKPFLRLSNVSPSPIPYSDITIRYWLTAENFAAMNTFIDYAQLGAEKVKTKYVPLSLPRTGAFGYIEYSFEATAGNLAPGANSGEIQSRIAKQTWTNFNEGDDYSFATSGTYADNPRITVYRNGTLVWGSEPATVAAVRAVSVQSENKNVNTTTNTISTYLKINHEGNTPVEYKDLTVRYWFTAEGIQSLTYWIDYAELSNAKVKGQFVRLPALCQGADAYFEITIDSTLGNLYPLSNTGNIQFRLAKTDWSSFNESNDHSYKPAAPFASNDHVTVYYKGQLIYGTEPTPTNAGRLAADAEKPSFQAVVYPNPSTGPITLELVGVGGQLLHLHLSDVTGRSVYDWRMKSELDRVQIPLPLVSQPTGPYVLKIGAGGQSKTLKVIKQ